MSVLTRNIIRRLNARGNRSGHEHCKVIKVSPLFDERYYRDQLKERGIFYAGPDLAHHYLIEGDKIRISPHPLFNTLYYYSTNQDIEGSGMSALVHFILHGAREGRNPHPLFDSHYVRNQCAAETFNPLLKYLNLPPGTINPHPAIDDEYVIQQANSLGLKGSNSLTIYLNDKTLRVNPSRQFSRIEYRTRYPDTSHMDPLEHYILHGKSEHRTVYPADSSIYGLESQIEEAVNIEYDLLRPHTDISLLNRYHSLESAKDLTSLFGIMKSAVGNSELSHVFMLPHIEIGGAEKVLVNILEYIVHNRPGERVLILVTDSHGESAVAWIPKHADIVVLNISDYRDEKNSHNIMLMLCIFFQMYKVSNVYTMNSDLGWSLYELYGRSLSQFIRLHGFAFCYDLDEFGRRAGYAWTHLPHCISILSDVITDNGPIVEEFCKDIRLSSEQRSKFFILHQPVNNNNGRRTVVNPAINRLDRRAKTRRVLWAGRFHKQKNISTALMVAALLPQYEFVFAGGYVDHDLIRSENVTSNTSFIGPYNGFVSLLSYRPDLFLHTSNWDGLPNVLLEAAAADIPIVARAVGGVPDLITTERGWLATEAADAEEFADLIRQAFADNSLRKRKIVEMSNYIGRHHSWSAFCSNLDIYYQRGV